MADVGGNHVECEGPSLQPYTWNGCIWKWKEAPLSCTEGGQLSKSAERELLLEGGGREGAKEEGLRPDGFSY